MGTQAKRPSIEDMQVRINALTSVVRNRLASFMGYSHAGARDLYKQFGYSRNLQIGDFYASYQRGDIANRIIRAFPQATWREAPIVRDDAGDSVEKTDSKGKQNPHYSAFADAFQKFAKEHRVFHFLERADRLSSIGRYGVLVMGFRDGKKMEEPLSGNAELMYMVPHSEANVTVAKWDTDTNSPRFGLPEMYRIQSIPADGATGGPVQALSVHHTRAIHISEFLDSDEVYGQPRLEPIFNRLTDLEKVVGGGAETFWLTANRGLAVTFDKDTQVSDEVKEKTKEMAEEYQNQLRRTLMGKGMTVQSLGSDTADPKPYSDVILDLVAGTSGVPKRILLGTERGELASSQDENNWSLRIDERRKNYAGPVLLHKFVLKMIETGNVIAPQGEFYAEWPKHNGLDPQQAASIAQSKASAIATYANSAASELVVPIQEFRRDILGLEPESEFAVPDEADIDEEDPNLRDDPQEDPAEDGKPADDKEPEANSSRPRTLYVSRRVLNVAAIKKWAEGQGFVGVQDNLHVTVVYSKTPIDWMIIPQDYAIGPDFDGNLMVPAGGPRVVEEIGPGRYEVVDGKVQKVGQAIALLFTNGDLSWRHQRIVDCGATHAYEDFQPHITISWDMQPGLDLSKVEPYQGAIALGPEIFAEIEE